jgi:hypothetical protein
VNLPAAGHHRIGRLHEKKRRLLLRVLAHLARMRGVIATDAVNAVYWKFFFAADDRHRRDRPDVEQQLVFAHGQNRKELDSRIPSGPNRHDRAGGTYTELP